MHTNKIKTVDKGRQRRETSVVLTPFYQDPDVLYI